MRGEEIKKSDAMVALFILVSVGITAAGDGMSRGG